MKESVNDIILYIRNRVLDDITIGEVADYFGYSRYHFSREFKRVTGFSASDYLSSLKIEYAKQEILRNDVSITDSGFNAGFSSLGTFSTTFTKKTGMSPREYKDKVETLYTITKKYEMNKQKAVHSQDRQISENSTLLVNTHFPDDYEPGITFIGLFKSSIPNHRPALGTALMKETFHIFKDIPNGEYHLLVCSIEKTKNPLRYFILDECLRGKWERALSFPEDSKQSIEIYLREALPEDPPILINLPKLLADTLNFRNP